MSFATNFVRAIAPVAIAAAAAPAAAQSADLAKVQAHLSAVQSMTANFTQTDALGRAAAGTVGIQPHLRDRGGGRNEELLGAPPPCGRCRFPRSGLLHRRGFASGHGMTTFGIDRLLADPALLHELARLGVPAGAVRSVGEALSQEAAQAMLLPGLPQFPYLGLRTVAFRSSAWPVVSGLSAPPEMS